MSAKVKVRLPEIMLFIVAAIVPVIVRDAYVFIPPELQGIYMSEMLPEFFSYHKAWILCVCAIAIVLHGISDFLIKGADISEIKQKARPLLKDPIIIMVAIYLLFVIVSNLLSPYTHTALWGVYDRREGLFVQLAYMTIFLATLFIAKNNVSIAKFLLVGLMISSLIMGAIGFSQFINRDFWGTYLGGWIITGHWHPAAPQFEMSYGTNFNPNTFGLVTAMLTPVLFAAALTKFSLPKNLNQVLRVLFILAGALMAVGVVGSRSVGGLIGVSTAVVVIITTLLVSKVKMAAPRRLALVLAVIMAVVIGTGFILRDYIEENLTFTLGRVAAIFEPPDVQLPDLVFEGLTLTVTDRGITYSITFPTDQGVPTATDAAGIPIMPAIGQHPEMPVFQYVFAVPDFGDIIIQHEAELYIYRDFWLVVEDGRLHMLDPRIDLLIDPNEPIPTWGFEGWETWGSNRGYIFARTIPLLPRSWLIGRGSDTFLLQFPTHDLISNYRYFQNPYILVDKAHNLYLQTAVTTGIISALALIAIFGYYILTTFWSFIRSKDDEYFWLRLGILASVSAFSISSLSTDSTVSSTPMFWIIIGIGFALNRRETNVRGTR